MSGLFQVTHDECARLYDFSGQGMVQCSKIYLFRLDCVSYKFVSKLASYFTPHTEHDISRSIYYRVITQGGHIGWINRNAYMEDRLCREVY